MLSYIREEIILPTHRLHRLTMKNLSTKFGIPPFKLFVKGFPKTPKTIRGTSCAIDFPLQCDGNTLLLKIIVTGYEKNQVKTDRKFPSWWLTFIVLEGALEAAGKKYTCRQSQQWTLRDTKINSPARNAHCCNRFHGPINIY